jgi:heat shock protein HslJ
VADSSRNTAVARQCRTSPSHVTAPMLAFVFAFVLLNSLAHGQQVATSWVLQGGQKIPGRMDRTPHLSVEGKTLSGSTGCNSFTAAVSERPGKRIAIEWTAITRKLCLNDLGNIEAALLRAFEKTAFIDATENTLRFLSAEGTLYWSGNDNTSRLANKCENRKPISAKRTFCPGTRN